MIYVLVAIAFVVGFIVGFVARGEIELYFRQRFGLDNRRGGVLDLTPPATTEQRRPLNEGGSWGP